LREITVDEIGSLCRGIVFERAREYVRGGKVGKIEISGDIARAIVHGAEDYDVSVKIGAKKYDFNATCTCPYSKGGQCKHVVAVLLKLAKRKKAGSDDDATGGANDDVDRILREATEPELKAFLRLELARDDELRDRLLIQFGRGGKSIDEYKRMVENAYMEVADRSGFIKWDAFADFDPIEEYAERHTKCGNLAEALKIYKAITEVVDEWQNSVDDSCGHYSGEFKNIMRKMTKCIESMNLDRNSLFEEIDYFALRLFEAETDYFTDEYWNALMELCNSQETLEYAAGYIEPHVPNIIPRGEEEGHYRAASEVERYAQLLERLADYDGEKWRKPLYELYKKHAARDYVLLTAFIQRLVRDDRLNDAIHVAEQGLQFFHEPLQIKKLHAVLRQGKTEGGVR